MKKTILMVLVFIFIFQSCARKEGVQNTKEQVDNTLEIEDVYYSDKIRIVDSENLIQSIRPRKSLIDFSSLAVNYTDDEKEMIKCIKLEYTSMTDLKGVEQFCNLEKLTLLADDVSNISDLALLKKIKLFSLHSSSLNNVIMENLPESLEGVYIYSPIQNDIVFTEKNKKLKYISFKDKQSQIKNIFGLENMENILYFSFLYCPLENPEELLKLKGLTYEIDFTVSRNVPLEMLNEIINELKINNPDCHRIFGCYYDEIDKIQNEFISPE